MLSVTPAWQTRIVWFSGLLGMPERNSTERNNFSYSPLTNCREREGDQSPIFGKNLLNFNNPYNQVEQIKDKAGAYHALTLDVM